MRHYLAALLLAVASFAAFTGNAIAQQQNGSAPFCTVDNLGTSFQCYYHSLDSCRAAAGPSGSCVVNQQRNNGNSYDFTGGEVGIYGAMRRAQEATTPPAPVPSGLSARQQRWLRMCDQMEQGYFTDLESIRSRFNPPMTADEYAEAAAQFRQRGEYCRSLAR